MYIIKPNKVLPLEFKIKVNPDQSYYLQKYLFSKGVAWSSGGTIQHTDEPCLYVYKRRICYGSSFDIDSYFNEHKNKEIEFYDYFDVYINSTSVAPILKEFLKDTTQGEFDKMWEEIKNIRLIGPTIDEYLKSK